MNPQRQTKTYYNENEKKIKIMRVILKAAKGKMFCYEQGKPIRLSAYFLAENFVGQKGGHEIFKVVKSCGGP